MAKKKNEPEAPGRPEVDSKTGIGFLELQINKGRELLQSRPLSSDAHSQWVLLTSNYLVKAFGRNSPNVKSVTDVGRYGSFPMNAGETWWEQHRAKSLTTQISRIEALLELLVTEHRLQTKGSVSRSQPAPEGHRIFLVHGHDEAALHQVARFLEQLDQDIIVLREQPNRGRTIIEKFEEYANVGFAVVLLTPDDRGGTMETQDEDLCPRARQNVILELGYFLGKLGRARVCALYGEGVEIPSDYTGVLYIHLDGEGAWRLQLAKELKAANLPIDMNKAL